MEDLTGEYEKLLSPILVKQYKCRSISKILDEAYMYHTYEDFLLLHLKVSKRMYNKTLSEIKK
jgi:hypothetical protein